MFEPIPSPLVDTFHGVADAGVVATIGVEAREENAACARRLEAMGELYARRAPEDDTERAEWAMDGHENVVAEVCAELGVSRARGRGQLRYAIALRGKLPMVMRAFRSGTIDMRMVRTIVNRTELIEDPALMSKLDAALATWAPKWMRMSGPKVEQRIDWWIERIDPAGRRMPDQQPPGRQVDIWPTGSGLAGIDARLRATDGAALDTRLDLLADTVCPNDPRTRAERRADALGALAAGLTELRCECGSPDCAAGQRPTGTDVVIHVLAEQPTVDGTGDTPGYLRGFGPLPATTVQDLAQRAKLKPLSVPDPTTPPEQGYRPSAALAEFVRARDLTCRWPGCEQPAERCDLDHTVPWPAGPTHPSNLKLYCRAHHLIKTFFTGTKGWADRQLPDGTMIFTSPSGRSYTTEPGGALFFPILATATGEAPIRDLGTEASEHRGLMMPRRKRTRAEERHERITAERKINEQRLKRQRWLFEELERQRAARAANDPPPF